MVIIQWTDSLDIHIDEIDNQHKKLVGIINNLAESMAEGKGKNVLGKIIKELVDYTITHFQAEERIFKVINYPDSTRHKKQHAEFVQKIQEFKENFDKGQLCLTVEVMNFLCDWVRNHIKKSDKKYALFIEEQGLQVF